MSPLETQLKDIAVKHAKELAIELVSACAFPALEEAARIAGDKLEELLLPRDPNDDRDVILEVKAGAGGDEAGPAPRDPRIYSANRAAS